jgi:hypothetical protein
MVLALPLQNSIKQTNNAESLLLGIPIEVIAALVGASATAVAFFWTTIQTLQKRRLFQNLIYRELEELAPDIKGHPLPEWHCYIKRDFVHKKIFDNVSENRDFILSLDRDLIYYVSQLWYLVIENKENARQWLYYLYEISRHSKKEDLRDTWNKWAKLVIQMQHNEYTLYSKALTDVFVFWAHLFYNCKISKEERNKIINDKHNAKLTNISQCMFSKFKNEWKING